MSELDKPAITTDVDVQGGFRAACSHVDTVRTVERPLDIDNDYSGIYQIEGAIGEKSGDHYETVADRTAEAEGPAGQTKPDLIRVNSSGGVIDSAEQVVGRMADREEVIFIDGKDDPKAGSSASVIASAGDRVIMSDRAVVKTHEARYVDPSGGVYVQSDVEENARNTPDSEPGQKAFREKLAKDLADDNDYFAKIYETAHPSISAECARSLLTRGYTTLSPEEALKLGLVDEVYHPDRGTVTVREGYEPTVARKSPMPEPEAKAQSVSAPAPAKMGMGGP